MWFQIAVLVVSIAISAVFRPKQTSAKPSALEDFSFPQGAEGTPQIEVFGTVWVEDWMVLGVGNFRTSPIRK